ncbi:MAG: hypothetical protein Fur0025_34150 [Oscillatoriaceae cyanobacterium]
MNRIEENQAQINLSKFNNNNLINFAASPNYLEWQVWSTIASRIVVGIGTIVIVGWIFDIPLFKSVLPGLVTMKGNTAIGFVMGGIALELMQGETKSLLGRRIGGCCAILVMLIGLLTMM